MEGTDSIPAREATREALYRDAADPYGSSLERLARAYEADPEKRRDLLQEIHLQLWRSFHDRTRGELRRHTPELLLAVRPAQQARTPTRDRRIERNREGELLIVMLGAKRPMNPWTLLESTSIYRNPWIHVREDRVLRPDGRPGIYGVIEIPPSIAVLALDEEDRLLLIGQWRYTRNKYTWELPIGGVQASDLDMQAAAGRELREEAGVAAAHWRSLGTLEASIGVTTDTQWMFLATGLTQGASTPDPEEQLAVQWVRFADAVGMVLRGEIREAASTTAILKLDALRRYGLL